MRVEGIFCVVFSRISRPTIRRNPMGLCSGKKGNAPRTGQEAEEEEEKEEEEGEEEVRADRERCVRSAFAYVEIRKTKKNNPQKNCKTSRRKKKRKKKKAKKVRFVGGKRKKGQRKFKSNIVPAFPQPATSRADAQIAALRAPQIPNSKNRVSH